MADFDGGDDKHRARRGFPSRALKEVAAYQDAEGRVIWQLVGVLDTYGS